MKIVIINYGLGNLFSIEKAFKRIGYEVIVTNDNKIISMADKLVIPGVGHFDLGMESLKNNNLEKIIKEKVLNNRIPILGICLGMQLLTNQSDEGKNKGLEIIDLEVSRMESQKLKIPHMGWNKVINNDNLTLLKGIDKDQTYYFVHSYCINNYNSNLKCGFTKYHSKFISVYEYKNIFGVQFHPEKSHEQGLQILKNFGEI